MKGKCLCGKVVFEVTGKFSNLYQCHCVLCQKATGTSSCSSMITDINNVKWLNGKEQIKSFTKENGFRTDFCSVCGSPVPNKMNVGEYMWIPAGILEGDIESKIVSHIFTESKPSWDEESNDCKSLLSGPDNIEVFMSELNSN